MDYQGKARILDFGPVYGPFMKASTNKKSGSRSTAGPFGEPAGARTQDPNIKSVVLYQLSYGIIRANPELAVLVVQMYRKFLFCQNNTIFLYGILIIVNLKTR